MRRVAVRGIAYHEGKILSVRLKPYNELAASGGEWWCLPGGSVDDGEGIEAACMREMIEETGIQPVIGKLLYINQFSFKDREHLEFFFHIVNATDYLSIDLTKASHGASEIEQIKFMDPSSIDMRPSFLKTVNIEKQIQEGLSVQFFS